MDCEYRESYIPKHINNDKASIWLYKCLENHTLSQKLSWLLSDKTHLLACYQSQAYLCQDKYAEATLMCLRAVERNQPSLMSEIDPLLFLSNSSTHSYHQTHRRCSSLPDTQFKTSYSVRGARKHSFIECTLRSDSNASDNTEPFNNKKFVPRSLRVWNSMPDLRGKDGKISPSEMSKCHTNPSTPVRNTHKLSPSNTFNLGSVETKNPQTSNILRTKHVVINNENIIEHAPPLTKTCSQNVPNRECTSKSTVSSSKSSQLVTKTLPDYGFLTALAGEKDYRKKPKKTFIEDGGMSVLPMNTG